MPMQTMYFRFSYLFWFRFRSSVQYSALPEVTDDDEKDNEQFLQEVIYHDDPEPRPNPVTMTPGKSLSLIQIILLNAVVCGVEICACAGFTYIPPMLLKAGYTEENMSIILGMGPLLGFIFVPIIGRASDNCFSSWEHQLTRFDGLKPYSA